jgi:hypothetical protein
MFVSFFAGGHLGFLSIAGRPFRRLLGLPYQLFSISY